jgi:energy-coupling factor transporter ATP-binding protein EcfA2
MSEDQRAIAFLEAALGWDTLEAQGLDDFLIKDIWGIYEFLKTNQSYYFVGSRGAGKSTLVAQAVRLLGNNPQTLVCVLDGDAFRSVGEGAERETIRKFIKGSLEKIFEQIKLRAGYERIARISSVYAAVKEWADFHVARHHISTLVEGRKSGALETFVRSGLRVSFNAGPLGVSLLEAGPLRIGKIAVPLELTFNASAEADKPLFDFEQFRESLNAEIGAVEPVIESLVNEIAKLCKKQNINEIVVLCDDFHLLSVVSQVRIIHFLRRVIGQLKAQNISMILKIFSATNLSPYIKEVLGLRKELMVKRIDSSLENLEQKRQAVENLLVLILKRAGWSDDKIRRLFRREVIDLLLVLSGGHPRRFLEMSASLIKIGNVNNLYHDVMFAAAKVLNVSSHKC